MVVAFHWNLEFNSQALPLYGISGVPGLMITLVLALPLARAVQFAADWATLAHFRPRERGA